MVRLTFAIRCSLFIFLGSMLSGCAHFGDDFTARNEKGEWWDLGYKFDLAWNQGGAPLEVLAKSTDGDLRRRALLRLSEPGDSKEREHYLTVLSTAARAERDTVCRLAAVQQLATYKDPTATRALVEAYQVPANVNDKYGVIQVTIVQALGQRKDPAGMDTLVAALDPKNQEDLRAAAAHSLGRFPDYKASEALLASLKQERSTSVKHEVHQSLVKITGRDLPADAGAWETAFQQAASKGEPLAKEPNPFIKLVNWISE
jgi:hypothetical protein